MKKKQKIIQPLTTILPLEYHFMKATCLLLSFSENAKVLEGSSSHILTIAQTTWSVIILFHFLFQLFDLYVRKLSLLWTQSLPLFDRLSVTEPSFQLFQNNTLIITKQNLSFYNKTLFKQGVSQNEKERFCPLNVNWENMFGRLKSLNEHRWTPNTVCFVIFISVEHSEYKWNSWILWTIEGESKQNVLIFIL